MRYDREGDAHFDIASALMKSLRGSDPDAALHYLARLLEAGDMTTAIRRLLCSASEDVGMAYPQAALIVKACVDNALQLGLPEARLPLAQAVVLLATAPKSNSVYQGIAAAMADVKAGRVGTSPVNCKMSTPTRRGWSGSRGTSILTTSPATGCASSICRPAGG